MRQRKLAVLAAFSAAACVLASIAGWSQTKDECASINRAMPVMTQGLDEMNSAVEKLKWDDSIAETSGAMKAAAKDASAAQQAYLAASRRYNTALGELGRLAAKCAR